MLKKIALLAAATSATFVALPAAAEAQRYGNGYGYDSRYQNQNQYRTDRYGRTYDRYGRQVYANNNYGNGSYGNNGGYYGRSNSNQYGTQRRCSGTTGTIVGGIAGALLGREVAGYRNRTTGTIVGGAVGALAGRAVDKSQCR